MIKVQVLHLPEVQAALAGKAARLTPALNQAATVSRRLLVAELSKYPAAPAGSRYVRTFRLRRGWERASPITGGKGFELVNSVEYAKFVQGDAQSGAHSGRWETASAIAHRLQEEVMAAYEAAIQEAVIQ